MLLGILFVEKRIVPTLWQPPQDCLFHGVQNHNWNTILLVHSVLAWRACTCSGVAGLDSPEPMERFALRFPIENRSTTTYHHPCEIHRVRTTIAKLGVNGVLGSIRWLKSKPTSRQSARKEAIRTQTEEYTSPRLVGLWVYFVDTVFQKLHVPSEQMSFEHKFPSSGYLKDALLDLSNFAERVQCFHKNFLC